MSWFIWSTTLTVDQIDNRVVFVEWENESFSVIPQEWLPNDVQEGDTVTLSLKPTVRSNCVLNESIHPGDMWLDCQPHAPLLLLMAPPWDVSQNVIWDFSYTTDNWFEGKIRLSKKQD